MRDRLPFINPTVDPGTPAILAPGRQPLGYGQLHDHLATLVARLNGLGVGRGQRLAYVLPPGPEMAVASLAIVSACAGAPLNPAFTAEEFEFYLGELGAEALVVMAGVDSPARAAARSLGIRTFELVPQSGRPAGFCTIEGPKSVKPVERSAACMEDIALLLHTSGTTSKPKIVPLSLSNLTAAALEIGKVLQLTPRDRCLNVMPLFHIHGLSALFSSMIAGASVACPPGFVAPDFFPWMGECRPTWFTAAPAIYQSILERAPQHLGMIRRNPLRFLRSASSAMPVKVMEELERVFNAPMVEAYGMTEAGPQIASNPLPPGVRKPGSVGLPAGPKVAILDERGDPLAAGRTGEVAVRGRNVITGYLDNPAADEASFSRGWLRTGDLGHLDEDGYLFITGRIKEIINRGGEKISPLEVEHALLEHPAVARAAVFPVPDAKLGEVASAIVVLKPQRAATRQELADFLGRRLAYFKVPQEILVADEIPTGPTGKIQRLGLAKALGLPRTTAAQTTTHGVYEPPRTPTEIALARIWAAVLRVETIGANDDFFGRGGDSILAMQVAGRVAANFGVEVPVVALFERPRLDTLAEWVDQVRWAKEGCASKPGAECESAKLEEGVI